MHVLMVLLYHHSITKGSWRPRGDGAHSHQHHVDVGLGES